MVNSLIKTKCLDFGLNEKQTEQALYDINLYYECTRRLPDSKRLDDHLKIIKGLN